MKRCNSIYRLIYCANIPCLSLWERWPSTARTERVTMTIPKDNTQLENARRFAGRWHPMNASYGICFSENIRWKFKNRGLLVDLLWIFIAHLPSWLLKWMDLSTMRNRDWIMILNGLNFWWLMAWRFCDFQTGISTEVLMVCVHKLTLLFETDSKTLSVTCGDSSPKGRAKAMHLVT